LINDPADYAFKVAEHIVTLDGEELCAYYCEVCQEIADIDDIVTAIRIMKTLMLGPAADAMQKARSLSLDSDQEEFQKYRAGFKMFFKKHATYILDPANTGAIKNSMKVYTSEDIINT